MRNYINTSNFEKKIREIMHGSIPTPPQEKKKEFYLVNIFLSLES